MEDNNEKNRYWTFIIYPESAPKDWKDILQQTFLPIAISPLHDKDLNDDGEKKKPHYHIIVCFSGPTTFMRVNRLCSLFNSPIPKRILSVNGMYRYFTHKDNPEKYQYEESDIQILNNFDIREFNQLTTSQTMELKKAIQKLIQDMHITEYCTLMDYLLQDGYSDMYQVACTNTLFFDRYISSKRNLIKESLQKIDEFLQ